MRFIAAFLLFVLAATPVFAQDDLAQRRETAQAFVKLTTADSVMGPMIDAIWPSITMQLPARATGNAQVMTNLKETFTNELTSALADVFDDIANAYADAFTLEELDTYVKFYSSPAGAKLVSNQGVLMQQMMPTITARLQQTLPQAMQAVLAQAQSGN